MKLYEMSNQERLDYLIENNYLTAQQAQILSDRDVISEDLARSLSENQIGAFSLPYGFATDVVVNGKEYIVPMVTEEPSVVAAASNGAKRVKNSGGFKVQPTTRNIFGQIILKPNNPQTLEMLNHSLAELTDLGNESRPSLVKRGGGIVGMYVDEVGEFLEIVIQFDTVDAMGANIVNSMLEVIAHRVTELTNEDILSSILSNSGIGQIVKAEAKLNFEDLATKDLDGQMVAEKIVQLNDFAHQSYRRAVTNNKGIMNGIDAIYLATGNDFRAEEAAAHSTQDRPYAPFSDWKIINNQLIGTLEMPIEIGSVGGAISSLPMAQISLAMMKIEDSKELQSVVSAVGLANNLSAMRALVSTGIQKGHMSLQSKSLAVSAGAKGSEIEEVSKRMNELKEYNLDLAKKILGELRGNN
ncbi:hydroxymethylglutaryl-CoA reductase, degradative [Lactobacillus terrae]|uniref:hydroxymethylglutaryl-CoA reductase, degradative n=1 Tax=Lactobacillus terrae TaxID=2269374 RepID=UPI000C1B65DD|nr:hydroxymethylglutaryl-CoA reductase, degradative [Lactobacillus terrae]